MSDYRSLRSDNYPDAIPRQAKRTRHVQQLGGRDLGGIWDGGREGGRERGGVREGGREGGRREMKNDA